MAYTLPPLLRAVKAGDLDTVKTLIAEGQSLTPFHPDRLRPMHLAAEAGHLALMQYLHTAQSVPLDQQDRTGNTALFWAALRGHGHVVNWLIAATQAQTPAQHVKHHVKHRNLRGENALFNAAFAGVVPLVQTLIAQGCDPDLRNVSGHSALMNAAAAGHLPVVQALFAQGAALDARTDTGEQALHFAAEAGHEHVVQWLLQQGCSPNCQNQSGETPMMWATLNGHSSVKRLLLEHGADPDCQNNDGQTAADYVIKIAPMD